MTATTLQLNPPRFENGKPMLIAGLRGHFTTATWMDIPAQWEKLGAYGKVPAKLRATHYGLCFNLPNGFDYLCGVEVSGIDRLPAEFSHVKIPAQRYTVFSHREHVSKLRHTMDAIRRHWPADCEAAQPSGDVPDCFERYGEGFDPRLGMGDIEIWIPIRP